MTAAEPVYASTSALDLTPEAVAQSAFSAVSANLQQFVGQQFQLQIPDQAGIQLPSSSQVLHIRASDGAQVQEDQIDANEEATSEQTGETGNASLG
jgi:negative regulator of sigma E activity